MQSPAERLAALPEAERNTFIDSLTEDEAADLLTDWRGFLARPNQIMPEGDWQIWLLLAGRGFGKTRTGSEAVREEVESGRSKRIALVAETHKDLVEVMAEGDSGLLNVCPPGLIEKYTRKPFQINFKGGAVALGYNATQPDQLRGPQFDFALCDELAKWRYARETWDQLQFGLRLGTNPRSVITTTPRPIELVRSIVAGSEGKVHVTRGRTMDNRSNLAGTFLTKIEQRYGGTRLGRQELEGEILGDMPGALWRLQDIDAYRVKQMPKDLGRIVVAVDPAVTNTEESDEHGIIVAGLRDDEGYILDDGSTKGTPMEWASRAVALHDHYGADGVVVEVNQGGDMVASTLRSVRSTLNIIEVRASRGKHVRAEPIAALYQQGRVHHVGSFPELETQMTMTTNAGYEGENSPDRLDAAVWALTELFPDMIEVPNNADELMKGLYGASRRASPDSWAAS
jgi:phage terminase large subunit-like protein